MKVILPFIIMTSVMENPAPGWHGIAPRWTSSAKEGVGTSASYQSRVWFTISHGILNEVYYPRIDQANTRDMEFLVADGDQYFSEEKRDTNRRISPLEQGVPGYRLVNSCKRGRYRMTKVVITDPERDVLLQKIHFDVGKGKLEDYGVYALLAPHIGNRGYGNNGWIGNYKGTPMLFAQREGVSLALACSTQFRKMSCGYVGVSDGWQDVSANKRMTWEYSSATNGNIALTAELDLVGNDGECVIALSFGRTPEEAGQQARNALLKDFDRVQQAFVDGWKGAQLQNMWLDGSPYWGGVQMDETAFPILVADQLKRVDGLSGFDAWPMIMRAAGYLVRNGAVTQQDRWEEDGGYSPFTLAAEIAGLLAAGDFAEEKGDYGLASYLRDSADTWNEAVERWTYVTGTKLANRIGVNGYYVRIASTNPSDIELPTSTLVSLRNRPLGHDAVPGEQLVSVDALALVRYGLRSAKDPRILDTVKVIDEILRKETRTGPVWHRYNLDGYGEHDDGSPFDGTGVGRGWPLLAGERAHYEIAKGNVDEAERLLHVIEAQASPGGLIPEQVWDAEDIPKRGLHNGRPAGSAMPLVWAHAEYIKLARSIRERKVFDMPPQPAMRYQTKRTSSKHAAWRFNQKIRTIPHGRNLRVEVLVPATIHWSRDGWKTVTDSKTVDTGLGIHYADIETTGLTPGESIVFTFFWPEANKWEGADFQVTVSEQALTTVQVES